MPAEQPPAAVPEPPPLPPHVPLTHWYGEAEARQGWVNALFDRTAVHYDAITQAMSFGTGRLYRKRVLGRCGLRRGMRVLDVASGTGQLASAALDLGLPRQDVVGVDPSAGMLAENRKRWHLPLVRGLGERLPLADRSFDFVMMGYALRHVADLDAAFTEFARVLRPRGSVCVLEITKPGSGLGGIVARTWLQRCVPLLARLRTGSAESAELMRYYWETIATCVPPSTILLALRRAGFVDVTRSVTGGIFSEYVGRVPA